MRRIAPFLLLFAIPAYAGTISRIYDFESGTKIQADQVDAELDSIVSAVNGNIESVNITDAGIATADIASRSVTKAKLDLLQQQFTSSSAAQESSSVTDTAVTNLSASLTVSHRPVWVGLISAGGDATPGFISYRNNGVGASANVAYIDFRRASTSISKNAFTGRNITSDTNDIFMVVPCSAFWFIDNPGSGTYTYDVTSRIATGDSGIIKVENCKLVVFEL